MNKRPLCLICIAFMAVLWMLDLVGLSALWKPPGYQKLQNQAEKEMTCTVRGEVKKYERKETSCYVYLEHNILTVRSEQYFPKLIIVKYTGEVPFFVGDTIVAEGNLELFPTATNPGQFDTRAYYHARNVDVCVSSEEVMVEEHHEGLRFWVDQWKQKMAASLEALAPEHSGILFSMLLGDKSMLDADTKVLYQMSGISHILAISGLHLSLLGMGLYRLLLKAGANHVGAGGVALVFLFCYGILTGESVSVLRALLMFSLQIGARLLGRTYDLLSALSLAALLILLEYPGYLYDSSFLLSFGALVGLGGVLPVFTGGRPRLSKDSTVKERLGNHIKGGLLSGGILWIVTLPIVLTFFFEVSVYGVLLNLFVIPTMGIILIMGGMGGILGMFWVPLGKVCIFPAVLLLRVYESLGKGIMRLPMASLILGKPQWWKVAVYYVVLGLFLLWYKKCLVKTVGWKRGMITGSVLGMLVVFLGFHPNKGLTITALDVGQGDSLVISSGGGHFLIDGGSSSVNEVGTYRIQPFLKSQGIGKIDTVFITHSDVDHMSGILELFELIGSHQTGIEIGRCALPKWLKLSEEGKEIREMAAYAGIDVIYMEKGDELHFGEIQFHVLHPDKSDYSENTNAGSLTLKLTYHNFSGLFAGDLCEEGEEAVKGNVGKCDLLKVAHHGSKNSTDETFLEEICPDVSIISAGKNNRYGHPHRELIERLEKVNSSIHSTAEEGAVVIRVGED